MENTLNTPPAARPALALTFCSQPTPASSSQCPQLFQAQLEIGTRRPAQNPGIFATSTYLAKAIARATSPSNAFSRGGRPANHSVHSTPWKGRWRRAIGRAGADPEGRTHWGPRAPPSGTEQRRSAQRRRSPPLSRRLIALIVGLARGGVGPRLVLGVEDL